MKIINRVTLVAALLASVVPTMAIGDLVVRRMGAALDQDSTLKHQKMKSCIACLGINSCFFFLISCFAIQQVDSEHSHLRGEDRRIMQHRRVKSMHSFPVQVAVLCTSKCLVAQNYLRDYFFPDSTIDIINVNSETPSQSDLEKYMALLVFANQKYQDPEALGNAVAAYALGGGGVVTALFNQVAYAPAEGKPKHPQRANQNKDL